MIKGTNWLQVALDTDANTWEVIFLWTLALDLSELEEDFFSWWNFLELMMVYASSLDPVLCRFQMYLLTPLLTELLVVYAVSFFAFNVNVMQIEHLEGECPAPKHGSHLAHVSDTRKPPDKIHTFWNLVSSFGSIKYQLYYYNEL